jgi:DNA repair protein RadC
MGHDRWLERRAELAEHGLLVRHNEAAGDGKRDLLVQGETLQHEPALIRAGARWDCWAAAWRLPEERQLDALAVTLDSEDGSGAAGVRAAAALADDVGSWFVCEGDGATSFVIDGARDARRSIDPRVRRLAKLPPEALETDELLEVLLAFGTTFPAPQRLAAHLLDRFRSLGAVLAAEPTRYRECLALDHDDEDALLESPAEHHDRHWRVSTLLKIMQECLQRVLKEEIENRPVIGSWTALINYLHLAMQHEPTEHFRILFLDKKNILIRDEVQSRGTVDHTPLYPREVVRRALELGASAIIMVHNHPSGDPTHSAADLEMTKQVVAVIGQVGITVHDHIIVGKNRHTSFRTQKLI